MGAVAELHLEDLALEMGAPVEQLVVTLTANHIPHSHPGVGIYLVTEEVADRLRSIYAHTVPETPLRPTPKHLREEYDIDERRDIRYDLGLDRRSW